MGIRDGIMGAARFLRDSIKICPGEAGRRIREKQEDERIREARTRKVQLRSQGFETPGYTVFKEPEGKLHPEAKQEIEKAIRNGADLIYTDEFIFHN